MEIMDHPPSWDILERNYLKSIMPSPLTSLDSTIYWMTSGLRLELFSRLGKVTCQAFLQLFSWDQPIAVSVECFEYILQILLLEDYWVLQTAGNEFNVVEFSVMISIHEFHHFLDFLQRCPVFLPIQSVLQLFCCNKTIAVGIDLLEQIAHLLYFLPWQLRSNASHCKFLQLTYATTTFENWENFCILPKFNLRWPLLTWVFSHGCL